MDLTKHAQRLSTVNHNHNDERSTTMNITTTRNSDRKRVVNGSRILIALILIIGIAGVQVAGAEPLVSSTDDGGSGGSAGTETSSHPYEQVLSGSGYIISETTESRAAAPTATAEQIALIDLEHGRTVLSPLTIAEVLGESGYFVPEPFDWERASDSEYVTSPSNRVTAW